MYIHSFSQNEIERITYEKTRPNWRVVWVRKGEKLPWQSAWKQGYYEIAKGYSHYLGNRKAKAIEFLNKAGYQEKK